VIQSRFIQFLKTYFVVKKAVKIIIIKNIPIIRIRSNQMTNFVVDFSFFEVIPNQFMEGFHVGFSHRNHFGGFGTFGFNNDRHGAFAVLSVVDNGIVSPFGIDIIFGLKGILQEIHQQFFLMFFRLFFLKKGELFTESLRKFRDVVSGNNFAFIGRFKRLSDVFW
jgi:hypothetical protein